MLNISKCEYCWYLYSKICIVLTAISATAVAAKTECYKILATFFHWLNGFYVWSEKLNAFVHMIMDCSFLLLLLIFSTNFFFLMLHRSKTFQCCWEQTEKRKMSNHFSSRQVHTFHQIQNEISCFNCISIIKHFPTFYKIIYYFLSFFYSFCHFI